jgi:Cu-processing system permease protein
MNKVWAIATVVIKELYRRKDFYVLFVLTALITLAAGSVNFFNDHKIVRYLKDICLSLIWFSSLIIAVVTTARQLPAEKENRTIFPLLAKPVSRGQLVLGKFLGCWLACGIALVMFYGFFMVATASREAHWALGDYGKAMLLHWAMLAVVVALTLLGSIVFTAVSSNATICLIAVVGILFVGGHLHKLSLRQSEPAKSALYAAYLAIPHLEWFNVRDQLVMNVSLPSLGICSLAALYGGAYAAVLLYAAWWRLRRQSLTT